MKIWAANVTLIRKDNLKRVVTVENVVISGDTADEIKNNPTNLTRALRYANIPKAERDDPSRWRIKEVLPWKELGVPGEVRFNNATPVRRGDPGKDKTGAD